VALGILSIAARSACSASGVVIDPVALFLRIIEGNLRKNAASCPAAITFLISDGAPHQEMCAARSSAQPLDVAR